MKQRASSLFASTGLLVIACALTAGEIARAAQLNPTIVADDVVTLVRNASPGRPCESGFPTSRVLPDGTQLPFIVPVGKALVITDVEGEVTRNSQVAWPVGAVAYLTATLTGAIANQTVRARGAITADAADGGVVTTSLHLQSGVVADSGAVICLSALVTKPGTFYGIANLGTDTRLHGYLIPR